MCVCTHHNFFINLSVVGHLDCFHILVVVNNAAMNIEVHIYFQISVFIFSGYILRNGISGSYDRSIFSFLRKSWVQSLGWEDPLEKGMATHSSILAWRIPWTEKPCGTIVHGVAKSQTQLSNYA